MRDRCRGQQAIPARQTPQALAGPGDNSMAAGCCYAARTTLSALTDADFFVIAAPEQRHESLSFADRFGPDYAARPKPAYVRLASLRQYLAADLHQLPQCLLT